MARIRHSSEYPGDGALVPFPGLFLSMLRENRCCKAGEPIGGLPVLAKNLITRLCPAVLTWTDVIKYAKYSNPEPYRREEKTDAEWQAQLTPEQYQVTRQKGTEPPYRNAYCRSYEPGVYVCIGCGSSLFNATEKYHAISGWPSFTQPAARAAVKYAFDSSHGMQRIEVQCNVCDCHLGHVFPDGPELSGLRYCINSESLRRVREGKE